MSQQPYGGGYPVPQQPYQSAPGQQPYPGGHAMPPQQQAALPSTDDFFSGGGSGAPSFDFKGINHGLIGEITHQQVRQRTKMGSTTEKLWNKDGSPQVQLEVTLQTALRGWQDVKNVPTGEDGVTPLPPQADTGLRRIYVWFKMRDAVQLAVGRAGAKHLEIGGRLGVKQSGQEVNPNGGNPIRTYEAVYYPPAPQADPAAAGFFGGGQQADAAPIAQYAPGPAAQFAQAMQPQAPVQYAPPVQAAPQQQYAPIPPQQQAAEPPF